VMDVAMARDEVKARLASIPVYTVANPKNEFVLVAGEVGRLGLDRWSTGACPGRPALSPPLPLPLQNNTQLGFFFLKREDAEALIDKVGGGAWAEAPYIARAARLLLQPPLAWSSPGLTPRRWLPPLAPLLAETAGAGLPAADPRGEPAAGARLEDPQGGAAGAAGLQGCRGRQGAAARVRTGLGQHAQQSPHPRTFPPSAHRRR
jgi:hypothetical protein